MTAHAWINIWKFSLIVIICIFLFHELSLPYSLILQHYYWWWKKFTCLDKHLKVCFDSKNIFLFHELSLPYSLMLQHHYDKELFVILFHCKRNVNGFSFCINCTAMKCVDRYDKSWFYDAYEHAQACKQHMAFNVPEM